MSALPVFMHGGFKFSVIFYSFCILGKSCCRASICKRRNFWRVVRICRSHAEKGMRFKTGENRERSYGAQPGICIMLVSECDALRLSATCLGAALFRGENDVA